MVCLNSDYSNRISTYLSEYCGSKKRVACFCRVSACNEMQSAVRVQPGAPQEETLQIPGGLLDTSSYCRRDVPADQPRLDPEATTGTSRRRGSPPAHTHLSTAADAPRESVHEHLARGPKRIYTKCYTTHDTVHAIVLAAKRIDVLEPWARLFHVGWFLG